MSKKILVVDDSAIARSIIKRVLEMNGVQDVEYLEANHGKEALEILQKEKCKLVFSDLNMPVMDGEELLKRIKASPKLNHIPVIIISSLGNPAKEQKLIQDHAYAVFTKPVSVPEVSQFINDHWSKIMEENDEF